MSETSAGSLKISKPQLPGDLCGCRQEIYYEMQKQMRKSSAESDSQQNPWRGSRPEEAEPSTLRAPLPRERTLL